MTGADVRFAMKKIAIFAVLAFGISSIAASAGGRRPFDVVEYGPSNAPHHQIALGNHPIWIPGTIAVTDDGAIWVHATLSWHRRIVRVGSDGLVRDYPMPDERVANGPAGGQSTLDYYGEVPFGFRAVAVRSDDLLVQISPTNEPGLGVRVAELSPDGTTRKLSGERCLAAGPDLLCGLQSAQIASCTVNATSAVEQPNGDVWFTDTEAKSRLGRVTPRGVCTYYSAGMTRWHSGPELLTRGPDSNLWFTEVRNRIGRISTTGKITEFAIAPRDRPFLGGIAPGPDGALWFSIYHGNDLGRITTSGRWKIYRGVTYPSRWVDDNPVSMIALDRNGRLYLNLSQAGRLARITIQP